MFMKRLLAKQIANSQTQKNKSVSCDDWQGIYDINIK